MAEVLPIPENDSQAVIALTSFAVAAQEVQANGFQEHIISAVLERAFNYDEKMIKANDVVFGVHPDATASITIPASVIMKIPASNDSIRITSSIYLNDQLFPRRNEQSQKIGSIIISASINTNNSFENLDPPVLLTFIKNLVKLTS